MRYVRSSEIREEGDHEATVVIRFTEKMEILSSAPLNGGHALTDTVFIMQVPHDYDGDYMTDLRSKRDQYGLPEDSVGFMTSAEVRYVFSTAEEVFEGGEAFVAATAGVTNCVEAGNALDRWDERKARSEGIYRRLIAGTINIVVVSSVPLDDAGKINLMIPLVEGKTLAMRDLGYTETGTTSDAMAIVSPPAADRSPFAGTGTYLGMSSARCVRKAVAECIRKRGESPETKDSLTMLAGAGIGSDMLWSCASALGLDESVRGGFEEVLRNMAGDPDICALVYGMLSSGMMADKGCINGQVEGGMPEVLTDGTLAIFLAGKISEDRGGDSTVDLLRMRPLREEDVREYAEIAAYGLVAGVVGYMTGFSDD
ncbi:bifunctional adenosylcobinamide hydrolase/alpha-ribazole phosphatase CbiS [Methanomethylophilus alvi]|uniref:bifunctional adenosylcobinamide hydrolase/alpha-ribazole phosphatase CbiS n=1 Tax=Methanomethylophilus alvi TaxID=1291540 RepID=UPI0037DCD9CA